MGVVTISRRQVWVETMGVASGYGCNEVQISSYLIISTSLVFALFCSANPYFCSLGKKCFGLLIYVIFV